MPRRTNEGQIKPLYWGGVQDSILNKALPRPVNIRPNFAIGSAGVFCERLDDCQRGSDEGPRKSQAKKQKRTLRGLVGSYGKTLAQASKQASKPDLHRLICGFVDGSGKRAMKLSDEVVAACARVGTTRTQFSAQGHSRSSTNVPVLGAYERLKRLQVAYFDSAAARDHGPDSILQ